MDGNHLDDYSVYAADVDGDVDVLGAASAAADITYQCVEIPKCEGQMKVISAIEQLFVIRRILKHLDLWEDSRPPPEPLELVCEPCADYVPWQDGVPEIEVG